MSPSVATVIGPRPDSAVSLGVQQGVLNKKFRSNLRDEALSPGHAETGVELTYSDRIHPRVTVQPDLQWIHNAGGESDAKDRFVIAIRFKIDLSPTVSE